MVLMLVNLLAIEMVKNLVDLGYVVINSGGDFYGYPKFEVSG